MHREWEVIPGEDGHHTFHPGNRLISGVFFRSVEHDILRIKGNNPFITDPTLYFEGVNSLECEHSN